MSRSDIRKLHLGCGSKEIPGWFHVDALDFPHVGHRGPVEDLSFIADGSVELIYASHVLEHFGRRTYMQALTEWRRVLAPGGVLRLAVPDFAAAARLYVEGRLARGIEDVRGLVSGGQRDAYDFHGMIFDEADLTRRMGYRYPPGAVRRLDDALLAIFGERYLALEANAHRADTLRGRVARLGVDKGPDKGPNKGPDATEPPDGSGGS